MKEYRFGQHPFSLSDEELQEVQEVVFEQDACVSPLSFEAFTGFIARIIVVFFALVWGGIVFFPLWLSGNNFLIATGVVTVVALTLLVVLKQKYL